MGRSAGAVFPTSCVARYRQGVLTRCCYSRAQGWEVAILQGVQGQGELHSRVRALLGLRADSDLHGRGVLCEEQTNQAEN